MDYDKCMGVLAGGAIGDSFGAEIEFMDGAIIKSIAPEHEFFEAAQFEEFHFTDDTQMTLFTAEGIINYEENLRYPLEDYIHAAYLFWLKTQNLTSILYKDVLFSTNIRSELVDIPYMNQQCAPGGTCISSLKNATVLGVFNEGEIKPSLGCGAVMRSAPFGIVYEPETAFSKAIQAGKLTHTHSMGYIPAGALAYIISSVLRGVNFHIVLTKVIDEIFASYYQIDEAKKFVQSLEELILKSRKPGNCILSGDFGVGWVGDEALLIAIYSVLSTDNYTDAIVRAAYHGGDSDSTASIAGNIAGAIYGHSKLPNIMKNKLSHLSLVDEYSLYLWRLVK